MEPVPILSFTCHASTYPAIDPSNPKNDYLSMSGRSILITGASKSIGAATVQSFAQADASNIILLGRFKSTLDQTAQRTREKFSGVKLHTYAFDLSVATAQDCQSLFDSIAEIGICVDTLILNASHLHEVSKIDDPFFPIDDFWKSFETNVRGNLNLTLAFLKQPALPSNATIINTSSFLAYFPGTQYSVSGYSGSKAAMVKVLEYLHFDRPNLRIFHLHPGTVKSDMCRKCGVDQDSEEILFDDADLPANFSVWFASSKADFLNGKIIEAMWDVEEMEKAKETILADERIFKIGLQGRGFVPLLKEQLK